MTDEQAALYDFFVYSQIFPNAEGKAERNEQTADYAEQENAERKRLDIFLNAERD
jgi:hypothetical protein